MSIEQMFVEVNGETLLLDRTGAAWWPAERTLILADIHFEKGSSFATRGTLLPPYDTRSTLKRIEALMSAYVPARIVALGDSFHDSAAAARLDDDDKHTLARQVSRTDWIWIEGNHDPKPPDSLQGSVASEIAIGPICFRHQPTGAAGEIAGHLHPKARVTTRARSIERRCIASDGVRAVMPSFGAYTGGLSIRDRAFAKVFATLAFTVHLLGDNRLHMMPASKCY